MVTRLNCRRSLFYAGLALFSACGGFLARILAFGDREIQSVIYALNDIF